LRRKTWKKRLIHPIQQSRSKINDDDVAAAGTVVHHSIIQAQEPDYNLRMYL